MREDVGGPLKLLHAEEAPTIGQQQRHQASFTISADGATMEATRPPDAGEKHQLSIGANVVKDRRLTFIVRSDMAPQMTWLHPAP